MYGFVLWLAPTVEKFPRRQKFLLGDRLQGAGSFKCGPAHDAMNLGVRTVRTLAQVYQR